MWTLLVSYVQGRRGVLDDRGEVIDTEYVSEWDADDFEQRAQELAELDGSETDELEIVEQTTTLWNRVWSVVVLLGKVLLYGVLVVWGIGFAWRAGGWIGSQLLNVPGVLGNIAGLATALLVWGVYTLLSTRLTFARRDARARCGKRNLADMTELFHAVDQWKVCGACGFSIAEFELEDDGCVRCPECGGAWNPARWDAFLRLERQGLYSTIRMRQRRRQFLRDGRGQMMRVLMNRSHVEREDEIRTRPARLMLWDCFLVVLLLSLMTGGVVGAGWLMVSMQQTMGGVIASWVAIAAFVAISVYGIKLARDGIRFARMQRLVRDFIDDRVCPSCEGPIEDEAHVIDGMHVCSGCGLAWDIRTRRRRHHCRKRITDQQLKEDLVFAK
jgi:hypothetical protein